MELFKANKQWATRPRDERFFTLQEMHDTCKAYAEASREKDVPYSDMQAHSEGAEVVLTGKAGIPVKLSNWAFGQLCQKISAPPSYLRELPPGITSELLNHGLTNTRDAEEKAKLLFHVNADASMLCRSITSDGYARIWNWEITERLLALQDMGWNPAKPDKRFDGGNPDLCQMCEGIPTDGEGACLYCKGTGKAFPSLYASDRDMFAFLRNRDAVIHETGNPDGLQRGVIVENSEVGASALKLTRFLYREMCGNHIIWGASQVVEFSLRHIGKARDRWSLYDAELRKYAEASASEEESIIESAKHTLIAGTKEEVLDKLFGIRSLMLTKKTLEASYDAVIPAQDGNANTVWGMVQGITRHSQTLPYADERTKLDKTAGKILEMAQ